MEDGGESHLPEILGANHIIQYIHQLGFSRDGGTISFEEIYSWAKLYEVQLRIWEVEALRRLSAAFASEVVLAKDVNHPAPFVPYIEATVEMRQKVDSFFKGLAKARGKK